MIRAGGGDYARRFGERIKNPVSIKKRAGTHCWGKGVAPERKRAETMVGPSREMVGGILMIGIAAGQRRGKPPLPSTGNNRGDEGRMGANIS
jgi:hypothetical protein